MVRKQTQNTSDCMIAISALVKALSEKDPDLGESYERYRYDGAKHSPLAEQTRQIVAALDKLTGEVKYDS
jgi:hypothetical protein